MTDTELVEDVERLLGALDEAVDLTGQVAVLWTWLAGQLVLLGSFAENHRRIREAATQRPEFASLTDEDRELLVAEPVRTAAELLARIELRLVATGGPSTAAIRPGVSGEPVAVCFRNPSLALALGNDAEYPPTAQQAPSLPTIAPRLSVWPVSLQGLRIEVERPPGREWEVAEMRLHHGLRDESVSVHLDPLADPGTRKITGWSGWVDDEGSALLRDATIADVDHDLCDAAARRAVECAAGPAAVLVLPELVATARVEGTIIETIKGLDEPPIITVVGLRHRPGAPVGSNPALAGATPLAGHVNEAVVLGPEGGELWRHRKLTRAEDGATGAVEAISLGDEVKVVSTPLGMMAVVICLDVFETHARKRLEESPVEVLLVPSLSPHAKRHRTSVGQVVQELWGVAFVCNRGLFVDEGHATGWAEHDNRSFWVLQRGDICVPNVPEPPDHLAFTCPCG